MSTTVFIAMLFIFTHFHESGGSFDYPAWQDLDYKQLPAMDGHRCGVCPTYFQKICAFDASRNATFIFDNHCVMDLYNCIKATREFFIHDCPKKESNVFRDHAYFIPIKYEHCVYFGNFAYVHGFKYEDMDYGEKQVMVKGSKKNPNYIRRLFEKNYDYIL